MNIYKLMIFSVHNGIKLKITNKKIVGGEKKDSWKIPKYLEIKQYTSK